jgi:hypothetical protein
MMSIILKFKAARNAAFAALRRAGRNTLISRGGPA